MRKLIDKLPKPYQNAPHNWDVRYISEVATIATGDSNTQDKVENGKYPFFVRSQTVERTNKYTFDGKAILTAGDGVGVGKVFHLVEGKFALHQRVYRISDFLPSISPEFLFLYFSNNFIRQVNKFSAKTSVDSVRLDMIARMVMPIPPLPEQQKIATIFNTWDKAISTTERLIDNSKQQKKALMQQLLTGKKRLLDDSGKPFEGDWEEVIFGDCIEHTGGTALEKHVINDAQHHFISIGNYSMDGKYIDKGQRIELNSKTKTKLLNKNDLVMVLNDKTKTGDIIGSTILIDEDNKYIYNQRSERIVPNKEINVSFFWYLLNSFHIRTEVFSRSQGGTQIYVNFGALKSIELNLPKQEEQQKISAVLTNADKEIELLEQQLTDLKQEKKALMQQLLTGKRRVTIDEVEVA